MQTFTHWAGVPDPTGHLHSAHFPRHIHLLSVALRIHRGGRTAFGRYWSARCTSRDIAWQHKALHDEVDNASLKQVNLVWSSQCAQCSCSSKLSWESAHAVHYSPRPIHWTGGVGFISCRDTGLQRHITPLPVLIPCQYLHHTSMEQRSQALLFPPHPLPYSPTRKSQVSTVLSAPNSKPRLFLNHLLSN